MTASVTWLGHATALIELDGVRLLTDPVLRDRVGPLVRISPIPCIDSPETLDAVLLSHLHADHTDLPSLRRLTGAAVVLAPRPAAAWLQGCGVRVVRELAHGEAVSVGGLTIRATPAVHDARRWPLGPRADPVGYLITGSSSVYFAGDTDLFPTMAEMRGDLDLALLPVSGWGRTLGPGHLDPQRAAQAAAMLAPRVAIPVHWGTFALGRPFRRPADPAGPAREFASYARRIAPAVEVRILRQGTVTRIG
jgi:L-ascorbate metabolism protein UlaG (beta-lactamase superfamily)